MEVRELGRNQQRNGHYHISTSGILVFTGLDCLSSFMAVLKIIRHI
jgi:hypothetical protein